MTNTSANSDRMNVDKVPSEILCDVLSKGEPTNSYSLKRASVPFLFELQKKARELGFDDLSLTPVGEARTFDIFAERVRQGGCDGLSYLTSNVEARRSPLSVLSDAETLIVVALSEKKIYEESRVLISSIYEDSALVEQSVPSGTVVGYATCLDYHDVLKRRLKRLGAFICERWSQASVRSAVDTAPLLEKDWATSTGLGFCGLHSLVIHRRLGTRFFLGELLVSVPFSEITGVATLEESIDKLELSRCNENSQVFDAESSFQKCLSCRLCLEACPTGAILGDRTLDARRCLNYWTIENREDIPSDIARSLDGRLFGCDLCQQVCPHNSGVFHAPKRNVALDAIESLDEETFRRLFKKTPVFRATLKGLQRTSRTLRKNWEEESSAQQRFPDSNEDK